MKYDVRAARLTKAVIGDKSLAEVYHSEADTCTTSRFHLELYDIPTEAKVILLANGIKEFYLTDNVYLIQIDAKTLIQLARTCLCKERVTVMQMDLFKCIKQAILEIDPALGTRLVPNCIYRGGYCFEKNSCGICKPADINHYKII